MQGTTFHLNIPAILVCGAVSLVIGFIWYGPLFGKMWAGYTGMTDERVKAIPGSQMARKYLLTFAAALVTALALDVLAWSMNLTSVWGGLRLGLWTGVGFSAMGFFTNNIFEQRPFGLWLVISGYQVFYQMAAAVILAVWR